MLFRSNQCIKTEIRKEKQVVSMEKKTGEDFSEKIVSEEIIIDNLIKEITDEYKIVTIINSHDMNSVMEIGEKIIFLKEGKKEWEGSKHTIFKTENKSVTNFVYSSNLYKKVREMYIRNS